MGAVGQKKGKIYYSMGEVAEMFDVNPSLIRFWESKFDILKPQKNKKGNRLFTPEDVDNLKLIYHLVREKGMTLAGAQKRIKNNPEGISRDMEVVERLLKIKSILLELRHELKMDDNEVYRDDEPDEQIYRQGIATSRETTYGTTENLFGSDSGGEVDYMGDEARPDYPESESEESLLPFDLTLDLSPVEDDTDKPRIVEQTLF